MNRLCSAGSRLPWLYVFPVVFLVAALLLGFLFDSPLGRLFFALSIVSSLTVAGFTAAKYYRCAPHQSESYVTWGTFIAVTFGTYFSIVAALLWIVFEIGRIAGQLG